jgi:hypothetical protein
MIDLDFGYANAKLGRVAFRCGAHCRLRPAAARRSDSPMPSGWHHPLLRKPLRSSALMTLAVVGLDHPNRSANSRQ